MKALAALPGVIVTGEVPDTRAWLAAADIVVAPLILARGVQNKVLEAMAMAKAVVASPAAATGIDALAGEDIIVAEGAVDQAHSIGELLNNPARCAAIGHAARRQIEKRYGWEARLAGLADVVELAKPMIGAAA